MPLGYVYLAIIVWCFVKHLDQIKGFRVWDWVIFGLTVALALAIIATYMYNQSEYVAAVANTVYPGKREITGGFSLLHLFTYPAHLQIWLCGGRHQR